MHLREYVRFTARRTRLLATRFRRVLNAKPPFRISLFSEKLVASRDALASSLSARVLLF